MSGHDDHVESAEPFVERYLHLLSDPAHWAFEVTTSGVETLVIALVLTPLIRHWVKRHDRKVHTGTVPTTPIGE